MADLLLPEVFDATLLACWLSCQQKARNEFFLGHRPESLSVDLHAGGCLAEAIETVSRCVWDKDMTLDDALIVGQGNFARKWGTFQIPEWKKTNKTYDRTWAAIEAYFEKWPPRSDYIQPYQDKNGKRTYEYTFAIPLEPCCDPEVPGKGMPVIYDPSYYGSLFPTHPVTGGPFIWGGRFDLLGYNVNTGRPIVRDEKSAKGIGDKWAQQWDLRGQFIGYVWACQQCGIDLEEVCVRGIAILMNEIKLPEIVKTYDRFLIAAWYENLRKQMWKIRRAFDLNEFEFNFAEACTAYGNCIFMNSCHSKTPDAWLSEFPIRRWNPLQKNPIEELVA